jgi:hypothetical protein
VLVEEVVVVGLEIVDGAGDTLLEGLVVSEGEVLSPLPGDEVSCGEGEDEAL